MDTINHPGLYSVSSPSGKQYIGITTTSFRKRYVEHLRHPRVSTLIGKAFRKYGEAMVMMPLVVCKDQAALDIMEQRAISLFNTMVPKGYNLSPGGNSPLRITMECEHCGEEFQGRPTISRWCSNNCKSAGRRASGVDVITKACIRCGGPFVSQKHYNIRHCSRSCGHKGMGGIPVVIDGITYPSLSEAERTLGLSRYILNKRYT